MVPRYKRSTSPETLYWTVKHRVATSSTRSPSEELHHCSCRIMFKMPVNPSSQCLAIGNTCSPHYSILIYSSSPWHIDIELRDRIVVLLCEASTTSQIVAFVFDRATRTLEELPREGGIAHDCPSDKKHWMSRSFSILHRESVLPLLNLPHLPCTRHFPPGRTAFGRGGRIVMWVLLPKFSSLRPTYS